RKDSGFEVTDKIAVTLQRHPETDAAIAVHRDYILSQVLGVNFTLADAIPDAPEIDMDDYRLSIRLTVVKGQGKNGTLKKRTTSLNAFAVYTVRG
ncbi:MAG: DUF5915 domain-containing protein, partial [Bacteroidales bacterium]|nr:DUF5915 domain-containing protein [Bacteroidales bacterium]